MPLQATSGAASYDAFGGGVPVVPNYIEEVFSTYLYTGTGATQTITNGINLSANGGMSWSKRRDAAGDHFIQDTANGSSFYLQSNTTNARGGTSGVTFLTNGYSMSADADMNISGRTNVNWTFRKQPKFFDVVTWTGNSTAGRQIPHSLGSAPGFVVVKRTSNANNWICWHRALTSTQYIQINSTSQAFSDGGIFWNSTIPDATNLTLGNDSGVNGSGSTYVAYLFAHDAGGFGLTGTDNVISCGSFTTDSGGNATVNLGYEPAWLMFKCSSNAGQNWNMLDTMRGWSLSTDLHLEANSPVAEDPGGYGNPTATGFVMGGQGNTQTYIYIAIRRGPMKVPTVGTSVFYPLARTGNNTLTNLTGFGFPPDIAWTNRRDGAAGFTSDKLRGPTKYLTSQLTSAEATYAAGSGVITFNQDGVTIGVDNSWNAGTPIANWFFKRAPSFMDVVCYTGTGAAMTVAHNLTVAPELIILKSRSDAQSWMVYAAPLGNNRWLALNTSFESDSAGLRWNDTTPTSSVFSVGKFSGTTPYSSASGSTYVAYLFATCAGVSKVGSYTGNGTTQTIDCGFTGGARFVLIKRTDASGDWYVYDTARGMTVLTDPYLFLNTTDAEVATLGSVTTVSTGFALDSTILAAINVSAGSYIFLAIA
jgi:hypothetical protein